MNILLWVLQVALALHTIIGAVWKFLHPEQIVPGLDAIPHTVWLLISGLELLCALGLLLPAINKSLGYLTPLASLCLATEMLVFCGLHFSSGQTTYDHPVYWLVVAVICAFIAYGRWALRPLGR